MSVSGTSQIVVRSSMATPRHRQIFNELHQAILSGRYEDGEKLPTDAELTKLYGVSRTTVTRG